MEGPLAPDVLFHLGPVPVQRQVVTTWGIMAALSALGPLALGRAGTRWPLLRIAVEFLMEFERRQFEPVLREHTDRHLPLLGTLFLFIATANLLAVVPGLEPPTSHVETPAALALVVFAAVQVEGLRARGRHRLRDFLRPNVLFLPIHLLSELSRTFSLAVRLFGNVASHELVVGVLVSLAGLLVPVPFLLLAVLIGLVQAYIFTMLATVFLAAAVRGEDDAVQAPSGETG
ncbi:ATP synthase subunit a [bacterium HR39]|nr:ATP synthase subunit a [bacterium HR39]